MVEFIAAIHLAIPVLGIIWLGIRRERLEQKKLLQRATVQLAYARKRKFR